MESAEKTPGQVSWTARNMALAGPGDQPGDVLAELGHTWDYLRPEEREAEEAGARAVCDDLAERLAAAEQEAIDARAIMIETFAMIAVLADGNRPAQLQANQLRKRAGISPGAVAGGPRATAEAEANAAELNGSNPVLWSGACAPGGMVCAVPDLSRPDGICGMPVESEPCGEHAAAPEPGQGVTCARCEAPLVPGSAYIGSWLARDVPLPGIGQDGQRPGLCPDGQPHEAAGRG